MRQAVAVALNVSIHGSSSDCNVNYCPTILKIWRTRSFRLPKLSFLLQCLHSQALQLGLHLQNSKIHCYIFIVCNRHFATVFLNPQRTCRLCRLTVLYRLYYKRSGIDGLHSTMSYRMRSPLQILMLHYSPCPVVPLRDPVGSRGTTLPTVPQSRRLNR